METWKKMIVAASFVTMLLIAGTIIYFQYFAMRRLMISTTTSLDDTGLLDVIEKAYESKHPLVDVQFIPVGTGIAIEHAQKGDVDLTLVHSPSMEKTFLEQGYGVCRKIIAYNFFTIVGPAEDPAEINGLNNVTEALMRIAQYGRNHAGKIWISRGDNSGTHSKEQILWKTAGFNYTIISTEAWYASPGGKMGETLNKAEELSLYTLSDTGTYMKYSKDGLIHLTAFKTENKALLNVYSAIAVNQALHKQANFGDAINFIRFLVSEEGQQLIENYGKDEYGQSLFHAAVQPLKQNPPSEIVQWIESYAFFDDSECPPEYRDTRALDLYD
ncbi:MAG: substrate-binding domain-containing protein [Candidatus Bathyarchaeia archaeon]